jgi:predicted  nucleic acid-binding Zn-ribbon protein
VAEEAADAANESEALRRAVAAVSSVKSMISGAVSDVTERLESASEQVAAVDGAEEQQRLEALRSEFDQTSARLVGSDDDEEEDDDADDKNNKND